jgi:hypothetical protein
MDRLSRCDFRKTRRGMPGLVIPGTAPDRRWRGGRAGFRPSKFNGKTLPDFVQALFKVACPTAAIAPNI